MRLHNTRSRRVEAFSPLHDKTVRIYSCGPTVYDHAHIGNLIAFIAADLLRRMLRVSGFKVKHVMNFTDVDDKTIQRSQEQYPDAEPLEALRELTGHYGEIFLNDMRAIGNDIHDVKFVKATNSIRQMQQLITALHSDGFAYIADDGVYFSIEKYQSSGKKYGQLTEITTLGTSQARIQNDEYDKASVHDFALWKLQKVNEPAWDFELDGHNLLGRPGWHVECSAMSVDSLGQPFDIHTGGVDLIFPHHENEIAQSTAGKDNPIYANFFVHSEHLLVDGHKMSKSLNNFFTLRDIVENNYEPAAFRLMVLQGHYRQQLNFSWESLGAAQNRLKDYQAMADMQWQPLAKSRKMNRYAHKVAILDKMKDDLNSPGALVLLNIMANDVLENSIHPSEKSIFKAFLVFIDDLLGLSLADRKDITKEQKHLLAERAAARSHKQWQQSDKIRHQLEDQGIGVRDTPLGQIWSRHAFRTF